MWGVCMCVYMCICVLIVHDVQMIKKNTKETYFTENWFERSAKIILMAENFYCQLLHRSNSNMITNKKHQFTLTVRQ